MMNRKKLLCAGLCFILLVACCWGCDKAPEEDPAVAFFQDYLEAAKAGSEEAFVQRMNQRAKELGMENTHFENPTGLDAEGHLSTARDIAIMSVELLKHPGVTDFTTIWMDALRNGETGLVNTNKLVRYYDGCTGLKTGTTDGAGSCLSASASRDGLSLVAVSMGSDTSDERFDACRTLLDYGFANFESFTPTLPQDQLTPIPVSGGTAETAALSPAETQPVVLPKGKSGAVEVSVSRPETLSAPVKAGQEIGSASFTLDGEEICALPLLAAEEVPAMGFSYALQKLWELLTCPPQLW